jgi:hypothetical protein
VGPHDDSYDKRKRNRNWLRKVESRTKLDRQQKEAKLELAKANGLLDAAGGADDVLESRSSWWMLVEAT